MIVPLIWALSHTHHTHITTSQLTTSSIWEGHCSQPNYISLRVSSFNDLCGNTICYHIFDVFPFYSEFCILRVAICFVFDRYSHLRETCLFDFLAFINSQMTSASYLIAAGGSGTLATFFFYLWHQQMQACWRTQQMSLEGGGNSVVT